MTYQEFWQPLCARYEAGEARAIARLVMETRYGLTLTDVLCGQAETLPEDGLKALQRRLLAGEPVQYVLGRAWFGERLFRVTRDVLIPRPETLELCNAIVGDVCQRADNASPAILDIGTGSGCIACTLALELAARRPEVAAWDISAEALAVARDNARRLDAKVHFERQDALRPPETGPCWDIIVSNPPYICERERASMAPHVKDHEPSLALFVPDDDPLLFYRCIAHYAATALRPGGKLYFEINPLYADALSTELEAAGLTCIETTEDQFGKRRFMNACI